VALRSSLLTTLSMPSLRPIHCGLLRCVGIAVLTVIAQGIWTDSAEATCGDWLANPAMPHQQAEDSSAHDGSAGQQDHHGQLPCRGPGCRKAPVSPLQVPPARLVTSDDDRCSQTFNHQQLPAPRCQGLWLATEGVQIPAGFPQRLDRPPRA
jgi:hypothetical protein